MKGDPVEVQGVFSIFASLALSAAACGQVLTEAQTLSADDAAPDAEFGHSVALSRTGSAAVVGAHEAGSTRGAAYLIRASEQTKLEPPSLAVGDSFGESVAIGSGYIVVGAPGNDDVGPNAGIAYVFDALTGEHLMELIGSDQNALDQAGTSVAIAQGFAAVGAPRASVDGVETGAVYLFDLDSGLEVRKLVAPDGGLFDQFGFDVAVSNGLVIVGAPQADGPGGNSGVVYVFEAATGTLVESLVAPDGDSGDNFGHSIAVDGDLVAVGAWADDDGADSAGSAWVYRISTEQFLHKLLPDDPEEMGRFGWDVAISGETVVVGAKWNDIEPPPGVDPREGEAYVFNAASGEQLGRLQQSSGGSGAWFGTSVSLNANRVLVGAPGRNDQEGRALLFELPQEPSCPSDVTGDGAIDLADLNTVLANFGQASGSGDTNDDGVVDLADLNAVLAAFGTACE
jgi:hypothetical protein